MECVFCEVRIQSSVFKWRDIVQVVSCRRLISEDRYRPNICEFLFVRSVTLKHVSLQVLSFSTVSIIPPILHTHFHLNTDRMGRKSWRFLRTFKQSNSLSEIGEHWTGSTSRLCFFSNKSTKGLTVLQLVAIPCYETHSSNSMLPSRSVYLSTCN